MFTVKIIKAGELNKYLTPDTKLLIFANCIIPKQMDFKNNVTNQAVKGMRQLTLYLGRPGGRWMLGGDQMTTLGNSRGKLLVRMPVTNVGNRLCHIGPDHYSI